LIITWPENRLDLLCNTHFVTYGVIVIEPFTYRYWKRIYEPIDNGPEKCLGIFREVIGKLPLEQAWRGGWRDATDLMWRAWQDPEFVEIDEIEAKTHIPELWALQEQQESLAACQVPVQEQASQIEPVKQPIGVLLTAAIAMNELFTSFIAGGFTEEQALRLLTEIIRKPKEQNERI
jgi:hypothetical protein